MVTEQDRTLKALRTAIQMEIDGKEYYLKASQAAGSKMGGKLLRSLSHAEDEHRQRFIDIYEAIRDQKAWPRLKLDSAATKGLKTVFSTATKTMAARTKPLESEIEAVQTAMKMENKTMDFYAELLNKATDAAEKIFYKAIVAEEREHHIVLQNYYEFLHDPTDWFTKTERHSLDGG